MKKLLSLITAVAIIIANVTIIPLLSVSANAAETTDGNYEIVYNSGDRIIVSLGDSYSSGEGIDPFFGSELPINDRINNADWLCHRSKNAWSGKLTLENSDGTTITMKDHRGNADTDGNWYFAAMSGAVTGNILDTEPIPEKDKDKKEYEHRFKKYKKLTGVKVNPLNPLVPKLEFLEGSVEIEPQLNVFQQLGDKKADYVTITMGGNDIDFTGIVVRAAVNVPFLEYSSLDLNLIEKQPISKWVLSSKLEKMVKEVLPITKERLEESYKRIAEKAGNQAHIIVAGYPKIISINSKNAIFTKEDAELINSKVSYFNDEIRSVVEKCQRDGINISFVSVEDKFGDYGAYYPDTNKELINRLKTVQSQDICEIPPISSYSIHPNEKGAEAYADCVQKEIERVEENRTRIWGQVVDVSNKPISGVKVTLTDDDNKIHITNTSDTNGNYGFELDYQEGRHYTVKFEAKDYKTLVVKEKKGGNRITINATLKKDGQEYTAEDLINKPVKEIVELMSGKIYTSEYPYSMGGNYFYNYDIFPGMKFYVFPDSYDNNTKEEFIQEVKNNNGLLYGIQVEESGVGFSYKNHPISTDMDYNQLTEIIGEMKCKRGTGALISGAWDGIAYTTETDNCKATINFDVNWDVSKYLSEDIEIPVSEMKEHNPKIKNIAIVTKPEQSTVATDKSLAEIAQEVSPNKYWVVFREGYRDSRVEMSSFDVNGDFAVTWNKNLVCNNQKGECNQFYYNNSTFEKIGTYDILTDYATEIIASNFNIYDKNGNIVFNATTINEESKIQHSEMTTNNNNKWDDYVSLLNEFVSSGKWAKLSETEIQNTHSVFSDEIKNYNDISNPDDWSITDENKQIFDMDADGIPEMILRIEHKEWGGPSGPAANTEFVAIKNGKAQIIMNAGWTGGSMRGDSISVCKNSTDGKYCIAYFSHMRIDEGNHNISNTYYNYSGGNVTEIHNIKKDISYDWSSRNSEPTIACTIDGKEVSETEYNSLSNSFSNVSNEDLPK